jgi:hypothetical protein
MLEDVAPWTFDQESDVMRMPARVVMGLPWGLLAQGEFYSRWGPPGGVWGSWKWVQLLGAAARGPEPTHTRVETRAALARGPPPAGPALLPPTPPPPRRPTRWLKGLDGQRDINYGCTPHLLCPPPPTPPHPRQAADALAQGPRRPAGLQLRGAPPTFYAPLPPPHPPARRPTRWLKGLDGRRDFNYGVYVHEAETAAVMGPKWGGRAPDKVCRGGRHAASAAPGGGKAAAGARAIARGRRRPPNRGAPATNS